MFFTLVLISFCFSGAFAHHDQCAPKVDTRSQWEIREADKLAAVLRLPAHSGTILGTVDTTFSCDGKGYGFFADIKNDCRVYHICHPISVKDKVIYQHHSFICPEFTKFDQKKLTCVDQLHAPPCGLSEQYFPETEKKFIEEEKVAGIPFERVQHPINQVVDIHPIKTSFVPVKSVKTHLDARQEKVPFHQHVKSHEQVKQVYPVVELEEVKPIAIKHPKPLTPLKCPHDAECSIKGNCLIYEGCPYKKVVEVIQPQSFEAKKLNLPIGVDGVVNKINTDFSCENRKYGYYADVANGCKIYHVCVPKVDAKGDAFTEKSSFFCPEKTIFDQKKLTCVDAQLAEQCIEAVKFYEDTVSKFASGPQFVPVEPLKFVETSKYNPTEAPIVQKYEPYIEQVKEQLPLKVHHHSSTANPRFEQISSLDEDED